MFNKNIVFIFVILFLAGCDLGGSGSTTTTAPIPVVEWLNLTKVANTYTYTPPPATVDEFIALGRVEGTGNEMCIVLWLTGPSAYGGCRNITNDGPWPAGCAETIGGTIDCPTVSSVAEYFMSSMGPARELTLAEAELVDEIRRKTFCTAPRLDGSSSPCIPS